MVSGLAAMNYNERLKELKMTTLVERREETDMVETFKILNGISDVNPDTWFTRNITADGSRTTRLAADPLSLRLAQATLELRKKFFSVRVCDKWNSLPAKLKVSKNVQQFKNGYRKLKGDFPA